MTCLNLSSLDMSGKLRAYVAKLSQMDAERLAGHDCMFARRLEDLRKFQAEVEPAIAEAMTAAPALQTLHLGVNAIGDTGAGHLANALAERGAAPALKTINLFQNQIGDEGARKLANALSLIHI